MKQTEIPYEAKMAHVRRAIGGYTDSMVMSLVEQAKFFIEYREQDIAELQERIAFIDKHGEQAFKEQTSVEKRSSSAVLLHPPGTPLRHIFEEIIVRYQSEIETRLDTQRILLQIMIERKAKRQAVLPVTEETIQQGLPSKDFLQRKTVA
jgi:hypothetical protein